MPCGGSCLLCTKRSHWNFVALYSVNDTYFEFLLKNYIGLRWRMGQHEIAIRGKMENTISLFSWNYRRCRMGRICKMVGSRGLSNLWMAKIEAGLIFNIPTVKLHLVVQSIYYRILTFSSDVLLQDWWAGFIWIQRDANCTVSTNAFLPYCGWLMVFAFRRIVWLWYKGSK